MSLPVTAIGEDVALTCQSDRGTLYRKVSLPVMVIILLIIGKSVTCIYL